MGSAFAAKTTLSPGGRVIDRDGRIPFELEVCTAVDRQQRTATPATTSTAVARTDIIGCTFGGDLNSTAYALSFFVHWIPPDLNYTKANSNPGSNPT